MIPLSQHIPIDVTADRFDEQHSPIPLRDIGVIMDAVPHRPDVFGRVMPVTVVEHGNSPFVGFKAEQVPGVLMPAIVESGQHQLRRDVSIARVSRVVFVAPNCFAEATPTDRSSVGFTPKKVSLFASPGVSSQQCVCDP